MPTIRTLVRHSEFDYDGSVAEGLIIQYASGPVHFSADLFNRLLAEHQGRSVRIGAIRGNNDAPQGSLGGWLGNLEGHASHIAAILVHEGYGTFNRQEGVGHILVA
jgi:hypothetical protein